MTRTSTAKRSVAARITAGLAAAGAAAALTLGGAAAASAAPPSSTPLSPGQGFCTVNQYAAYQVRADGSATGQGVKFKLLRNGVVVTSTPGRANYWAAEYRTSFGNFPGPGYYAVCAQNTGTANSTVTIQIRTDAEF